MNPHVLMVLGTRPQYVKALPLSVAFAAAGLREVIVDTGQHYDELMAEGFREGLGLRKPEYLLGIGSDSHARQTARMLEAIEGVVAKERPAVVLVLGDTNSTTAAALVSAKMHVPVAHVEAGLRSFNRQMPEEINRVVVDHLASLLLAPTSTAVANLAREGITEGVHLSGDVMYDLLHQVTPRLDVVWQQLSRAQNLEKKAFVLATVHRAENTNDVERWLGILGALAKVGSEFGPVIWPVHPRTRHLLQAMDLPNVRFVNPLPYVELQAAALNASVVLTDSGGLQKEAAFHGTPVVTLRDQTEWVELLEIGANRLAGTDPDRILAATREAVGSTMTLDRTPFGTGSAAHAVASVLKRFIGGLTEPKGALPKAICL